MLNHACPKQSNEIPAISGGQINYPHGTFNPPSADFQPMTLVVGIYNKRQMNRFNGL
jgi:hypothetical protein